MNWLKKLWKGVKSHIPESLIVAVAGLSGIAEVALQFGPELIGLVDTTFNIPESTFFGKYAMPAAVIWKFFRERKNYKKGDASGLSEKALDYVPDFVSGKKNSKSR